MDWDDAFKFVMLEKHWVRLVIGFILLGVFSIQQYHWLYFSQYDPYQCRALLNDGAWSPVAPDGSKTWEPKNCRMAEYTRSDIRYCLDGGKIVFAGDSTIRQIFWAAARRLEPGRMRIEIGNLTKSGRKHQDVSFETEGAKLEYIWDPWLNSSKLEKALNKFNPPRPYSSDLIVREDDDSPSALVVLGAPGLWAARYGGDEYLDIFKRSIDHITPYISDPYDESMPWNFHVLPGNLANHILLAPVQVPQYKHLSSSRRRTITAPRIKEMNDYLAELPHNQSSHILWAYNKLSADSEDDFDTDGLHVSDNIAAQKFDVVINAHCNAVNSLNRYPFKGTCCVPHHRSYASTWTWRLAGFLGVASFAIEIIVGSSPLESAILQAARIIVAVVLFCLYCDRTTFFGKLERHYQPTEFIITCLLWLAASILSMKKKIQTTELPERSVARLKQERNIEPPAYHGPGYLSRSHSLEIRGFMQGLILLYHYHHASQALWVYKIIRLFISGYIFLTAYGNTLYFLKTNDFSSKRVSVILFRFNLLSAALPYAMGTDYSLYYFAPVVTFWFFVVYGMLHFFRSYNHDMPWLIAKVIATASVVIVLISTHGVLEAFSRLSLDYCNINWDAREMRFRLLLDRYVVFVGTVVGAFVHNASTRGSQPILPLGNVRSIFSDRKHLLNVICATSLLAFFYVTQTTLHQKVNYNKVHPFISWIPILSFVVLRNTLPGVRDVYLRLPTKLGKISLETYVLQYHVWLAADATAKHTFGLWDDP